MDLNAGDTSLFCSGGNGNNKMKKCLDYVIDWFIKNKITINSMKFEILSFGKKHDSDLLTTPYFENKQYCKYLGVHIGVHKLKVDERIRKFPFKLARFCGVIYKIRHYFARKPLIVLCDSLSLSLSLLLLTVYWCKSAHLKFL